jgi:Mg/Co/Ni transporter MgtE
MKVSDWVKLFPERTITVPCEASLEEALDLMLAERCLRDLYVVSRKGKVVGHLSHQRLAHLLLLEHRPVQTVRQIMERVAAGSVEELMDRHFVSARPGEEMENVLHRQLDHYLEDMPVLDDEGKLLGSVNLSDVLRELRQQGTTRLNSP